MYDEIQKLIAPNTLSSFEYSKLEELSKTHTEQEIINAYRNVGYKPINYITKVLSKRMITTEWLNKTIEPQEIDDETKETYNGFLEAVEEFRKWERE